MPKTPFTTESNTASDPETRADENGLEADQDRGPEIEVPFDPSKIDIIVKPMSMSLLQVRLKNNELDLTPEFQRQANVWDEKRKSRLIESILLKIPLPSFYFSEDDDGTYAVVEPAIAAAQHMASRVTTASMLGWWCNFFVCCVACHCAALGDNGAEEDLQLHAAASGSHRSLDHRSMRPFQSVTGR